MAEMTQEVFDCLRAAVTKAKNDNIRSVATLRQALVRDLWDRETIDAALKFWAERQVKVY